MKRIEVPGHGIVEFPDDMTDDQIVSAIKANAPQEKSVGTGILSEVMKGMMQGGPPVAIARLAGMGLSHMNKVLDDSAYKAGGAVTDFASGAGASPELAGGLGYATNVGIQAIPAVVGGEVTKPLFSPALQSAGRRLMQSSLKPTLGDLKSGDAAVAIDTLLEKGINPNQSGMLTLQKQIDKLNFQVKSAIANSPETIRKSEVGRSLLDTYEKFKRQARPNADLAEIKAAWLEFRNHPMLKGVTDIPVQTAQEIKQGTNVMLRKKYGEQGTADVEAQKAIVRNLKDQIANKVPGVAGMNEELSKLYATEGVAERRALMEGNKNIGGMAFLAPTKVGLLGMLADSYGLSKSLLARLLYSGSEVIPANVARTTGLLYATRQNKNHGH